jgi:cytochrome oxidase assembly protein ShyY1
MSLLRHAFTLRWMSYFAVAVIFAVVTSLFGLWQWDRRSQKVAEIERVEIHFSQSPMAFYDALPPGQTWNDDLRWTPVEMRGAYEPANTLLVRTRPRFSQVGFEILVPFQLDSGQYVLVNRGWVPTGSSQDYPDLVPTPPDGDVTITGRLFASEPLIAGRSAPEGQVATIHLETIAEISGMALDSRAYVALSTEDPATTPMPSLLERPAADEGPHLSYTVQWFLFALLGFVAWGYLLREDYRLVNDVDAPTRRKARTDQDVEDELLDKWEATRA